MTKNEDSRKDIKQEINEEEIAELLIKAIEELPEKCKIIFFMSKYDHLKYPEIAEILDISIKTVEYHMGRAFKFLRKYLSSECPDKKKERVEKWGKKAHFSSGLSPNLFICVPGIWQRLGSCF